MQMRQSARQKALQESRDRLVDLKHYLETEVDLREPASGSRLDRRAHPIDDADVASDIAERDSEVRVLQLIDYNAEQVGHALELLHGGLYGRCEDCGKEIAAERLEAVPEATRCLDCQARHDRTAPVWLPPLSTA